LSCRNGCVNLSRQTQQSHVYAAGITIAHRIGSAWKIGAYQLHLLVQKYSWSHINQVARALRFFYRITLGHKEAFERIVTPVVLNELNKYAPHEGSNSIRDVLLDIAERGRSLGSSLFGAQQTASEVRRRVVADAVLKVVGRLGAAEAERSEYGFYDARRTAAGETASAGHDDRRARSVGYTGRVFGRYSRSPSQIRRSMGCHRVRGPLRGNRLWSPYPASHPGRGLP
jgi:hypothetical protein